MLDFDIYGLRARVSFTSRNDEEDVAGLLKFFLTKHVEKAELSLKFKKEKMAQEVGRLFYPYLAEIGIWAIHSGGFHFKGGHLVVGPSDCGKSTMSYLAMKQGFFLLSDDITLLRESDSGIEILPFYSTIFLNDEAIVPDPAQFKPAILKYFLFPRAISGPTCVKKTKKRINLLRRLTPQLLWSYDRKEQGRQKRFLEKLCDYPAFEVCWGRDLREDAFLFKEVLNEIVQG
ncbi:MAG: hypothetical protein U9Q38_05435 [Thermodesulfobacteriota bacterium]|nr:hypothetical protein [Thermodesulfobacteriota bacterium]